MMKNCVTPACTPCSPKRQRPPPRFPPPSCRILRGGIVWRMRTRLLRTSTEILACLSLPCTTATEVRCVWSSNRRHVAASGRAGGRWHSSCRHKACVVSGTTVVLYLHDRAGILRMTQSVAADFVFLFFLGALEGTEPKAGLCFFTLF